ncbi:MAG: polysaccharide deacetylase family protein [Euryarchaeota archaeon]|nr:polysaccharide deacetylase family protein [Euryarchaeota archaeon]
MEEGLPRVLDILEAAGIKATFFVTGEMAGRYPEVVKGIERLGHEVGCHGDHHERFDRLPYALARMRLEEATSTLESLLGHSLCSFRAPNLKFPSPYIPLLEEEGYLVDSSTASYKWPFAGGPTWHGELLRVPASITSSALRLFYPVMIRVLPRFKGPLVFFVHPWELVDMSGERIRFDCRLGTGQRAAENLVRFIDYYRDRGAEFMTMKDFYSVSKKGRSSLPEAI